MNTVATALLIVLAIVMFNNFKNGTLKQWFLAKFLNQAAS